MSERVVRRAVSIVLLCAALAAFPALAKAEAKAAQAAAAIDRFTIEKRISPAFDGRRFGDVGAYELIIGQAFGSLDPKSPANGAVVGLDKAPVNKVGRVEYSTQVAILRPVDMSKASGNLVYEVINRSIGGIDMEGKALDRQGILEVLLARGDVVIDAAWQGELSPERESPNSAQAREALGGSPLYAKLPPALENGKPLVRRIRQGVDAAPGSGPVQADLVYPAAAGASVTVLSRRYEADAPTPVPQAGVRLLDRYRVEITPAPGAAVYDIFYEATDAVISGVGFAVPRDLVSFLRHDAGDGRGRVNPLLGADGRPAVRRAYAYGLSQSGRYLRMFLWQGFNADAAGRPVFEGIVPVVAGGRFGFMNELFANAGQAPGELSGHRIADTFPFAYPPLHDPVSGTTDGLLKRCQASRTCPKVMQIDSENEAAGAWGWMMTTRPDGRPIAQQPETVRLYAIAGADHGGGKVRKPPACRAPSSLPVSFRPFLRAALVNMDAWVRLGRPPPASRYPSLADGTLTTLDQARATWPKIPGYPFAAARNVPERWIPGAPLPVSAGRYPVLTPTIDSDGNAIGGVRHPLQAAPTGTLAGVGARDAEHAPQEPCPWLGEYLPFARTRAERQASGDPRPSLEERYPGGAAELAARRRDVARRLVAERYLLAADEDEAAAASLESGGP